MYQLELLQDAWLDSIEVDPKYADKVPEVSTNDDEVEELTSLEIAKIKRRIANVLEPGETVIFLPSPLLFAFLLS